MKYAICVFLIFTLFSCTKSIEINIRFKNNSDTPLKETTFIDTNFGTIYHRQYTEYVLFEETIQKGNISIQIRGRNYEWNEVEFMGGNLQETGNYTFEINFDDRVGIATYDLVRD